MKPYIILLSALLALCAVCSCKKNSSEHPNQGTVLKMYTSTFMDTLRYYYNFDRDANNRVITMRDSSRGGYDFRANLTYNSNGKLAKVAFINNGHNTHNFEYEYNAAGQISKRKWRSGTLVISEDYDAYTYDAAGHMLTDSSYSTMNNITYTLVRVAKFKYTGENITEAENYSRPNSTMELESMIKYEYDNGLNPMKELEYQYYINEGGSSVYMGPLMSRNNVVKSYTADGNGGWNQKLNATYQYNSSKYVWKMTSKDVALTLPATVTEYFYQ